MRIIFFSYIKKKVHRETAEVGGKAQGPGVLCGRVLARRVAHINGYLTLASPTEPLVRSRTFYRDPLWDREPHLMVSLRQASLEWILWVPLHLQAFPPLHAPPLS